MFQFPAGSNTAPLTTAVARPTFSGLTGGGFDPLSLNPILAFEASRSMLAAGDGAAENLDLVATLENQVSGGVNATQTTASKQPRAHVPVGDGHLYLSGVSGNYASVPDADNLDGFNDFTLEFVGSSEDWHDGLALSLIGKYRPGVSSYVVRLQASGTIFLLYSSSTTDYAYYSNASHNLVDGAKGGIRVIRSGSSLLFYENLYTGNGWQQIGTAVSGNSATLANRGHQVEIGSYNYGGSYPFNGPVFSTKIWNSASPDTASPVLDVDFSGGDHKASTFACSTGQTVTINTSGNDPATIVRRNFLRFDGADSRMDGSFNESNTAGGYMFVVYSVNGNGGEASGRVFVMNSAGEQGYNNTRSFLWSLRKGTENNIAYYQNSTWQGIHTLGFDPVDGTLLHELKAVDGAQFSKVNNGDIQTSSLNLSLSSEEFDIGATPASSSNPAIDIEALYLFDHTLGDDDASKIRDYLNAKSSIY